MRSLLAAALLVVLAACENAAPSAPVRESSLLAGEYKPASNTARGITGGMMIQRAGLTFENGVVLYTRTLNPRRGGDLIAKNGDSFAAAIVGPGSLNVELRRVTEQVLPAGVIGLCGTEQPQYVALAFDARAHCDDARVHRQRAAWAGGGEQPRVRAVRLCRARWRAHA
jgi:hypothetical protein